MSNLTIPTNLVIFTGRLRSGKDFVAQIMNLAPIPLAEPLYEICTNMLGACNKENILHRRFLQLLGAWGRGEEGHHPELPTRDEVKNLVTQAPERVLSEKHLNLNIDLQTFGHPDFWINIATEKTKGILKENPQARLAIPNGRFPNEIKAFQRIGFVHMHVICSEATRTSRLGGKVGAEADNDITEMFAKELDKQLFGPTVIWNDPNLPVPPNTGWQDIKQFVLH